MVVFSMVLKEKFKFNLGHYAGLTFACASNEKHADSVWLYKQKRDVAGYYHSQILARVRTYLWVCVRMKRWVQRKKNREVWKEERGTVYSHNYQTDSSHIINRALITSQDYFSGSEIAEYCYIVWIVRSHYSRHQQ